MMNTAVWCPLKNQGKVIFQGKGRSRISCSMWVSRMAVVGMSLNLKLGKTFLILSHQLISHQVLDSYTLTLWRILNFRKILNIYPVVDSITLLDVAWLCFYEMNLMWFVLFSVALLRPLDWYWRRILMGMYQRGECDTHITGLYVPVIRGIDAKVEAGLLRR